MNTSKELGVDTAQQSVAIRHTSEHKATAEIHGPFPLEKPGESEKHVAYTFPLQNIFTNHHLSFFDQRLHVGNYFCGISSRTVHNPDIL